MRAHDRRTPAGLVAHLRWNEYSRFQLNVMGVPDTGQTPWTEGGHPDAEMLVDDIPLAQLLDEYDAECARSNRRGALAGHRRAGSVSRQR